MDLWLPSSLPSRRSSPLPLAKITTALKASRKTSRFSAVDRQAFISFLKYYVYAILTSDGLRIPPTASALIIKSNGSYSPLLPATAFTWPAGSTYSKIHVNGYLAYFINVFTDQKLHL